MDASYNLIRHQTASTLLGPRTRECEAEIRHTFGFRAGIQVLHVLYRHPRRQPFSNISIYPRFTVLSWESGSWIG